METAVAGFIAPPSSVSLPFGHIDQLRHGLLCVALLDHLLVVLWVLQLYVLVQTSLGAVALRTVFDGALVVTSDLSRRPAMPLFLLIVDLKRHVQHYLMVSLV